ncbi:unnamed protein product [Oncorhynchus mykiss]|uniref:Small ribosomal subunit protein uS17 n=1 Tax=Oncorhynchus mykiss TaxID=8022 RepID=A0A060WAA4_ONCMY|nr:unnamed protein product [Oncorhynchus mykiss]
MADAQTGPLTVLSTSTFTFQALCCVVSFVGDPTERAYQKQPTIFQNKKRVLVGEGGKEAKEKLPRYHKSVGLGFKTPREAIDGTYIDKKCPFTGNVSIRGRILSGVVTKMKMQRTIVIRRDYLHYIRK